MLYLASWGYGARDTDRYVMWGERKDNEVRLCISSSSDGGGGDGDGSGYSTSPLS